MKYEINQENYEVIIEKKHNKNTYIRVKEDLKIYVSTNYLISKKNIKELLDKNINYLEKMINKRKEQEKKENAFYYLGKKYDIIFVSSFNDTSLVSDKIYSKDLKTLEKWYKKQIINIFNQRIIYNYEMFEEKIPFPKLKIRTMKTRWGVCNRKNTTITLNTNLIKYDINKIDYVIIHELSHFIHFDHSSNFWNVVSKYQPDYKKMRKELRD